jgi:hypothetical protein
MSMKFRLWEGLLIKDFPVDSFGLSGAGAVSLETGAAQHWYDVCGGFNNRKAMKCNGK